jgi:hypothetical protein
VRAARFCKDDPQAAFPARESPERLDVDKGCDFDRSRGAVRNEGKPYPDRRERRARFPRRGTCPAGYTLWLAADKPGTYAARSRVTTGTVSVHDPELDSERFVREVATAAARLSVVAVLPVLTSLKTMAGQLRR